jgi:hypothetical protein
MPHVDEGLLHAYLDGAFHPEDDDARAIAHHLGHCADCRARLEEARRLRDRAAAILAAAEPPGLDEAPPFDELLARRAARTAPPPPHRRAARLPIPLAWAASIAFAIGAGWWAHELAGPAAQQAGSATLAELDATRAAPAPEQARAPDAGQKAAPDASAAREAEPRPRVAAERALEATAAARVAPPTEVAPAEPAPAPPIHAEPTAPADDASRIRQPVPHVPGLPIVETAVATIDGARVIRIRQRLEGGDTLEIAVKEEEIALEEIVVAGFDAPPAGDRAAPAPSPAPAAARAARALKTTDDHAGERRDAVVEVPRLGYRLTLRAPIPADSLRALARRIP